MGGEAEELCGGQAAYSQHRFVTGVVVWKNVNVLFPFAVWVCDMI